MPERYELLRPKLNELRMTILKNGPMTVYQAYTHLKKTAKLRRGKGPPLASVDRHMKILLDQQEIEVYEKIPHRSGQVKKIYGLTPYGFLRYFRIPGAPVLKDFHQIVSLWLDVPKFRFFVPKEEALRAINTSNLLERHMARYCQLIANLFGEAEDFLDCLEAAGYNESSPADVIAMSAQLAWGRYGRRFAESFKILTANLPTLQRQIRAYIISQRSRLDEMEKYLFP
jgi:hypothetical protein